MPRLQKDNVMKLFSVSIPLLLTFLVVSCGSYAQGESPDIKGPYLGQKPPGSTPEVFAPGIVTTKGYEYGGVFTPDMKEFYFIKGDAENKKQEFVVFQNINNQWRETVLGPRIGQPFISPDGKTMHLGKRYKERTEDGWSERKSLGAPFEDIPIMRLTASSKGTYYFDTYDEQKEDFPIRYSRLIDGKYEKPRVLSKEINTGTQLNHPFIAPDESYLIWDAKRDGGFGDSDIYISFRQQSGSWGEAINLGDKINTEAWDAAASVTPDGKYILFHRTISPGNEDTLPNVDIFWVDAQIIEDLRPKP
ncbi:Glutamate synthase [NADPH] large chain [hydrothermal vent metagenome]|uniref:Glutamate synthase [NADPH] large chain n=1 Tax=hydrothermal vent metagenome TaxID=652676 RepID=A0A3B0RSM9_9ZZZZ